MTLYGLNILDPLADWPVGVKHIRLWDCGVAWKDLNPAEGVFEWGRLDAIVAKAEASGVKSICLTLAATPLWAATDPQTPHSAPWLGSGSNSIPYMEAWEKFVWNVATRYRGRIGFYQIWNEPMLADFWYPYSRIAVLGKMTKRAQSIINRIDPAAKIVAAQVLPRPSSGGMRRSAHYLEALRTEGWPVDILSTDIYPELGRSAARWGTLVQLVRQELVRQRAPIRPFWVAETNFNLMGGPMTYDDSVRAVRTVPSYAKEHNVSRVYWYSYGVHGQESVLGIPLTVSSPGMAALRLQF